MKTDGIRFRSSRSQTSSLRLRFEVGRRVLRMGRESMRWIAWWAHRRTPAWDHPRLEIWEARDPSFRFLSQLFHKPILHRLTRDHAWGVLRESRWRSKVARSIMVSGIQTLFTQPGPTPILIEAGRIERAEVRERRWREWKMGWMDVTWSFA